MENQPRLDKEEEEDEGQVRKRVWKEVRRRKVTWQRTRMRTTASTAERVCGARVVMGMYMFWLYFSLLCV